MPANEQEIERLVVRLVGDGTLYQKMLQQAGQQSTATAKQVGDATKQISGFQSKLNTFAAALLGTTAGLSLTGVLKSWWDDFIKLEDSTIKLSAAIRGNGGDVEATLKKYQDFGSEMKKQLGIGMDQTRQLLKMAETYGLTGDKATNSVKGAVALAAATDQDAESMVRFAAAMAKGDIELAQHMARMIPQLRGIKDQQEFIAAANKLANTGLQTAADLANSTGGMLRRLWGTVTAIGTKLGRGVLDSLKPAIQWLTDKVGGIADAAGPWITNAIAVVKGGVSSFISWLSPITEQGIATFSALWDAVKEGATISFNAVKEVASWVFNAMGVGGVDTMDQIRTAIITALLVAEFAFKNVGLVGQTMWAGLKYHTVAAASSIGNVFTGVIPKSITWLTQNASLLWDAWLERLSSGVKMMAARVAELIKNLWNALTGGDKNQAAAAAQKIQDEMNRKKVAMQAELKMPAADILKRDLGPLEAQLKEEWEALQGRVEGDFDQFLDRRLKEMGKFNWKDNIPVKEMEKLDLTGGEMAKNLEKASKEASELQATLAGSSSAVQHILDYMDRVKFTPKAATTTADVAKAADVARVAFPANGFVGPQIPADVARERDRAEAKGKAIAADILDIIRGKGGPADGGPQQKVLDENEKQTELQRQQINLQQQMLDALKNAFGNVAPADLGGI